MYTKVEIKKTYKLLWPKKTQKTGEKKIRTPPQKKKEPKDCPHKPEKQMW